MTSSAPGNDPIEPEPPGGGAEFQRHPHSAHLHMRETHWRRPHYERRRMFVALAIALLLHVIGLLVLRDQMRWRSPPEDRRNVMQVRILSEPMAERAEPDQPVQVRVMDETIDAPPPQPARESAVYLSPPDRRVVRASESVSPARAKAPATTAADERVRLYGFDGRLLVDPQLANRAPAVGPRDFIAPRFVSPEMMRHRTPLPYESTRFDEDWTPDQETLLGEFVRENTHTYSTRTRWGGQITCSWMLFLGGCSFGYAPPNPEGLKRMRENPPFKPQLAPPGTQPVPPPPAEIRLETG